MPKPTSIRIPRETLARIDNVHRAYKIGFGGLAPSRARVMVTAIEHGLAVLEDELGVKAGQPVDGVTLQAFSVEDA